MLHLVGHQLRIILTMHGHTNIKKKYIYTQNSLRQKLKMDSERGFHVQIQHFASNYDLKNEGNIICKHTRCL